MGNHFSWCVPLDLSVHVMIERTRVSPSSSICFFVPIPVSLEFLLSTHPPFWVAHGQGRKHGVLMWSTLTFELSPKLGLKTPFPSRSDLPLDL